MIQSRTAEWFETKIKYEKTLEDGLTKKVTEQYVVDALSFTEAESRINVEMSNYISGEFDVSDIKKATYKEILFNDAEMADRWYKAKLQFITIDEKTDKEKRTNHYLLVQAGTLSAAVKSIEEAMRGSIMDYVVASIAETQIMDVYVYGNSATKDADEEPEYMEQTEE